MENMDCELRQHISETIDGSAWEAVKSVLWQNGTPLQLWKLERDIEFDGGLWRCVIVKKQFMIRKIRRPWIIPSMLFPKLGRFENLIRSCKPV